MNKYFGKFPESIKLNGATFKKKKTEIVCDALHSKWPLNDNFTKPSAISQSVRVKPGIRTSIAVLLGPALPERVLPEVFLGVREDECSDATQSFTVIYFPTLGGTMDFMDDPQDYDLENLDCDDPVYVCSHKLGSSPIAEYSAKK